MSDSPDVLSLKVAQVTQVLEQYRLNIYNLELRITLLNKMLEEKGVLAIDEFEKRWPLYLKNNVGVVGPDGVMEGSLRIKFYGDNK
jgi:hypothetical protein